MLCNILVGVYIRERELTVYQFAMEQKPVHIITNDDTLLLKLVQNGLEIEVGAEDYTEQEGLHYHYLVWWPLTASRRLSPTRNGAVKRFRRDGCNQCKAKGHNYRCETCGRYYKFIWCAGPNHTNNTRVYIQRKIDEDPRVDVTYQEAEN